jgi:hypothetical protein
MVRPSRSRRVARLSFSCRRFAFVRHESGPLTTPVLPLHTSPRITGSFLKSDFSGHSIEFDGNLGIFSGASNQYQAVPPAFPNSVHGCTTLVKTYSQFSDYIIDHVCPNTTDWPAIYNNTYLSPTAATANATVCGLTVPEWQAAVPGVLGGIESSAYPANFTPDAVVAMARTTLSQ